MKERDVRSDVASARVVGMRFAQSMEFKIVATRKNNAARNAVNRDEMNVGVTKEVATNANSNADIRLDLVNRVRAEIAAGTYYSDEKFEIALNRMFASFE